jgi:hypothetical protein
MKYEHFGICHVKSTAFARPLEKAAPLPDDYVGDFAEPSRPQDCCVVMRRSKGTRGAYTGPRRCRARRRLWNPRQPEKAALCCSSHMKHEKAAKAWHASLKTDD